MTEGSIEQGAQGELRLAGVLDYRTGPALREQGRALIRASSADPLHVDCSAVQRSSSVGLSLLLAFTRDAMAMGRTIRITGLSADMQELAQVCGLTDILALEPAVQGVVR
jgi:phospholipid transport system transporter-binding protein